MEQKVGGAIFIVSPLPRSGTNFLWEMLRRHPCCVPVRSPLWEDYVLKNAHHLERFVVSAQESWDPVWGETEALGQELLARLGSAVIGFLSSDPAGRLVTKSPTVENVELFPRVFPGSDLVLLIRDGRDVVASGMRTFGWNLAGAARAWAQATERALRSIDDAGAARAHVVRFEDLVAAPWERLCSLMTDLGLDPGGYDPEEIARIPVRGSAFHRGTGRADTHWDPVPRAASFDPVGRWKAWPQDEVALFESIAGPVLRRLGYECEAGA